MIKCNLEGQEMSMIKKMELEATKISGTVSLAQWVPWYNIPPQIVDSVIQKITGWQTNRYSIVPGIVPLREQVAIRYFKKYWVEIDFVNEMIITAWAIQAISALLLTILQEQDEVVLIDPCYASYNGCIKIAKWNPVYVALDVNLDLDVESIKKAITPETKAIVIANPNNPTGSIFSLEKFKEILDYISGRDIFLVIDEVYEEFIYDWQSFDSGIKLYEQYKSNLIIINSWSKSFGMTGWRVWYLIAQAALTKEILKIHDSLITCAPVHSQWAALASFEIYDEWTAKVRKELQDCRDYAVKRLDKLKDYLEFHRPWAAYFVFPRFRYTDDDLGECMKILHEAKLSLVPGGGFGPRWVWHFRICFGRDFPDLKEWFDRLENYLLKK